MLAFLIQVSDVDDGTGLPGRGGEEQSEDKSLEVGKQSQSVQRVTCMKRFLRSSFERVSLRGFAYLIACLCMYNGFACLCETQGRRNVSCLPSVSSAVLSRNITQSESICLLTCSISLMAIKSNCNVVSWNKVLVDQIGLIRKQSVSVLKGWGFSQRQLEKHRFIYCCTCW